MNVADDFTKGTSMHSDVNSFQGIGEPVRGEVFLNGLMQAVAFVNQQEIQYRAMQFKEDRLMHQIERLEDEMKIQVEKNRGYDKLFQDYTAIRNSYKKDMDDKDQLILELQKEVIKTQLTTTTVSEWIAELKDRFMSELAVLSDYNLTLEVNCQALRDRLEVLQAVEKQLQSNLEDEEVNVEGIFLSNVEFNELSGRIVEVGQNIWDNIKKRLLTIMQKPYQMFQVKDVSEQAAALKVQNAELKKQYEDCKFDRHGQAREIDYLKKVVQNLQNQNEELLAMPIPQVVQGKQSNKDSDGLVCLLQEDQSQGEKIEEEMTNLEDPWMECKLICAKYNSSLRGIADQTNEDVLKQKEEIVFTSGQSLGKLQSDYSDDIFEDDKEIQNTSMNQNTKDQTNMVVTEVADAAVQNNTETDNLVPLESKI